MALMVHYVRDLSDPKSDFWRLNPLRNDLAGALAVAREGCAKYPHAMGFRIVDEADVPIVEEQRTRA
ncbi:MAG: hypothetical protein ABL889_08090 [Terricaulis sp.]